MKQIRLSFVRTVFEGVHMTRHHRGAVLRLWLPLAVISSVFMGYFHQLNADQPMGGREVGAMTALLVAWAYVGTSTTLGLYRLFLDERVPPMAHSVYRWSGTHWRLLGWALLLWVLVGLVVLIPYTVVEALARWLGAGESSRVVQLLGAAVTLIGYYVYGRWVLVLPMTVMATEPRGLSRSWDLTEGNDWHMLLCVGLLPTCQTLIWVFLPAGLVTAVVSGLVTSGVMLAEVALVSRAVQRLFAFIEHEHGTGGEASSPHDDRIE